MERLERLVNLVAALLETPRPLTRNEIRERTPGYSEDEEAFRRNFERDKDLLRQMGFPLVTQVIDPAYPEDVGYRIPREQYELPDPGLDASELAALRLAASAVTVGGAGQATVSALRKLAGAVSGPEADAPAVDTPGRLAELEVDAAAAAAWAAVGQRRRVRFRYRGETREVDPWRLNFHRGHWYLAGWDHARDGERLFRLDRVEGDVEAVGEPDAFERPASTSAAPPPPWMLGDGDSRTAVLWVDAEQVPWALQALGDEAVDETRPDGSAVFSVQVTNPEAFRSFVIGFLDHAEVLAPPELRSAMIDWLEVQAR